MNNLNKKYFKDNSNKIRLSKLRSIFNLWDIYNDGFLKAIDLLEIGRMRRSLKQVDDSEWTLERNNDLLQDMDYDGDGKISSSEFCNYFNKILPKQEKEFNKNIDSFNDLGLIRQKIKKQNELLLIEEEWEIINNYNLMEYNNFILIDDNKENNKSKSKLFDKYLEENNKNKSKSKLFDKYLEEKDRLFDNIPITIWAGL